MVFRFQAAVVAADELERLLELGTTEDDGTELLITLDELGATDDDGTELLDLLDELNATLLGALELATTVPQPIGWVETTISSIHTSALRLLKLWKPNIT